MADQEKKLSFLFDQLKVHGTADHVRRYVVAPERHRPLPAGLRG